MTTEALSRNATSFARLRASSDDAARWNARSVPNIRWSTAASRGGARDTVGRTKDPLRNAILTTRPTAYQVGTLVDTDFHVFKNLATETKTQGPP